MFFYLQMSLDVEIIFFESPCVLELLWHNVHHTLLIESHVLQVVQELGFQLCSVCSWCHYLSHDLAISMQALMTAGLNYCNSLFGGLVMRLIWCLQLVQAAAVHLFVDFSYSSHSACFASAACYMV